MPDKVMRSKPAKHGKRLDGKNVIITRYDKKDSLVGEYHADGKRFFRIETMSGSWFLEKDQWTVEEIVETVEE